jgi:hypothetical protein
MTCGSQFWGNISRRNCDDPICLGKIEIIQEKPIVEKKKAYSSHHVESYLLRKKSWDEIEERIQMMKRGELVV